MKSSTNTDRDEEEILEEEERKESTSWFEYLILFFILVSCVHLTLENPLNNPEGKMAKALSIVDYITTAVFSLEFFIKAIAFGLIFNGPKSYLRHAWN